MSNLAASHTTTITGVFVTPNGAAQIFINNIGAAAATITGNGKNPSTGIASTAVTLAAGDRFALGYIGKGYESITIDATGTSVELFIT